MSTDHQHLLCGCLHALSSEPLIAHRPRRRAADLPNSTTVAAVQDRILVSCVSRAGRGLRSRKTGRCADVRWVSGGPSGGLESSSLPQ
ncbi:MAG: hypothetical protein M0C28_05260 [Candidatus Moduliflexus flocculans]|nr:hypothetical protein [Candidatus Moduliflexus flocculans]